jgi:hypothetical protein
MCALFVRGVIALAMLVAAIYGAVIHGNARHSRGGAANESDHKTTETRKNRYIF